MIRSILIFLVFICTFSLYTKTQFNRINQPNLLNSSIPKVAATTICNNINLDIYNYTGIVRSGYLSVNKGNSVLAFTFYGKSSEQNPGNLNSYPTIIWLNGGPGSSSQFGNLNELGPLWVVRSSTGSGLNVTKNKFSWANNYNLLFVDQPVGTGLSYADPQFNNAFVKNMADVSKDFYEALNQLYNNENGCFHSKYLNIRSSSPLFIFGESYAGKYVPAISSYIIDQKQKGGFLTGFKGAGIGDGFTDPYDILSEVGNYAFHLGLIDFQQRIAVEKYLINATLTLQNRDYHTLHDLFDDTLDYIIQKGNNVNVYDIRKYGDYEDTVAQYFHQSEVVKKFAFNPQIMYGMQADQVYLALYQDFMKSQVHYVQNLLQKGVPVLIYNGQDDLIVETPGTMKWVQRIHFNERQEFRNKLFQNWRVNGKVVGRQKSAGKLSFKIVFNAGHMVPMDQPQNSLSMVNQFINKYRDGNGQSV